MGEDVLEIKLEKDVPKYAVVMIDMQSKFLGSLPESERERLIGAHKNLLEYCYDNEIPIAFVLMARGGGVNFELDAILGRFPPIKI